MFSSQEIEILSVLEVFEDCVGLATEFGTRNAEWGIRDSYSARYNDLPYEDRLAKAREIAALYKENDDDWRDYLSRKAEA